MTRDEYNLKMKDLENEFRNKRTALTREFVLSNNPYKVGDILQDRKNIIRVERISCDYFGRAPECIYYGTQLNEDLTPKKTQDYKSFMYQNNVERKLN